MSGALCPQSLGSLSGLGGNSIALAAAGPQSCPVLRAGRLDAEPLGLPGEVGNFGPCKGRLMLPLSSLGDSLAGEGQSSLGSVWVLGTLAPGLRPPGNIRLSGSEQTG